MTGSLPLQSRITVTETRERVLNLSDLRYAIVCGENIIALFRWEERAEDYLSKYASALSIIDLKPDTTTKPE